MRQLAMLALIAVLVTGLAACGSSSGSASTNSSGSGPSAGSSEAESSGGQQAASDEAGGSGDCPLGESEVSSAIGEDVSAYTPPLEAEAFICEFSSASADEINSNPEARFENPTVEVTQFPLPDQEQKTPAALKAKLEEIVATEEGSPEELKENIGTLNSQPTWGSGAFLELTTHPANEVTPVPYVLAELWFPHQKITVLLPEGSVAEPYAVAKHIGDAAAE